MSRLTLLGATVLAAVAVSGCDVESEGVTRNEYLREINSIGKRWAKDSEAVAGQIANARQRAEAITAWRAFISIIDVDIRLTNRADPPEEVEDEHAALVEQRHELRDAAVAVLDAIKDRDRRRYNAAVRHYSAMRPAHIERNFDLIDTINETLRG